jgi:hypothetical protein
MAPPSFVNASETADASPQVTHISPDLVSQHIQPTTETNDATMHDADANSVLTPPTSEDMDKKDHAAPEMSDEEDDDWEIEPDHYWDGGRIPVFKPVSEINGVWNTQSRCCVAFWIE